MMNTESTTVNGHFAKASWPWWTQKVQPLMDILLRPDDYDNSESTTFNGHLAKARWPWWALNI